MTDVSGIRGRLLGWYDRHARGLPWRVGPAERAAGVRPDPYRVWLSEIMLQQTTTPHAAPYFEAFTVRWPTVEALAAADDSEVMAAWAGLGYYARARNLLACARAVASEHGGRFPDTEAGLRSLPGVGAYTAAAVAAIAFDRPANVVDGNVERVMSRLFAVETPLPAAKPELARLAGTLVADDRPGDWAQALMDLGATICTPKSPKCLLCPLQQDCAAWRTGAPETYPRKGAKAERPHRYGLAFVAVDDGRVALVRRPDKGLLGGMLGLPTSEWTTEEVAVPFGWTGVGAIEHVFTHFSLTLGVAVLSFESLVLRQAQDEAFIFDAVTSPPHPEPVEGRGGPIYLPIEEARAALPTVFRKALDRALSTMRAGLTPDR
jgi:A/G-specific adenine glycosylase